MEYSYIGLKNKNGSLIVWAVIKSYEPREVIVLYGPVEYLHKMGMLRIPESGYGYHTQYIHRKIRRKRNYSSKYKEYREVQLDELIKACPSWEEWVNHRLFLARLAAE